MRFLTKKNIPDELPDLAIENGKKNDSERKEEITPPLTEEKKEKGIVAGEDYLEFRDLSQEKRIPASIREKLPEIKALEGDSSSFFDKVLGDINDEIEDLGKLEDWYKNKFLPQDVVSNMRSYWEDNKTEMIIKSFGSEYKNKINEKIKVLQGLEDDWREIYFQLVKKEEEMKREERELKETLSEFVDLCKRRGRIGDEKEEKGEKKENKKEE